MLSLSDPLCPGSEMMEGKHLATAGCQRCPSPVPSGPARPEPTLQGPWDSPQGTSTAGPRTRAGPVEAVRWGQRVWEQLDLPDPELSARGKAGNPPPPPPREAGRFGACDGAGRPPPPGCSGTPGRKPEARAAPKPAVRGGTPPFLGQATPALAQEMEGALRLQMLSFSGVCGSSVLRIL